MSYYDEDDDGTMPNNVQTLADAIVGHKIVSVEQNVKLPDKIFNWRHSQGTAITLDNGKKVFLIDSADCCAYTQLNKFLLNADKIDHIITSVTSTDDYTKWYVLANMEEVLELDVSWSCGNPFYYSYGFEIKVYEPEQLETEWLKQSQS